MSYAVEDQSAIGFSKASIRRSHTAATFRRHSISAVLKLVLKVFPTNRSRNCWSVRVPMRQACDSSSLADHEVEQGLPLIGRVGRRCMKVIERMAAADC